MTNDQITGYLTDPTNWQPTSEIPKKYPQFNREQIKRLVWRRNENGLSGCYRQVGKRGYINIPMFGLWLGGMLPEQKGVIN